MFHHGKHKGLYRCQMAYRLPNGEIEGFEGMGASRDNACQDCLNQINRKLQMIAEMQREELYFEHSRLVESGTGLTGEEAETIKRDWASGVRYR